MSLEHPNLVKTEYISNSQDEEEDLFIITEYVSGGSIKSLLKIFGFFDEKIISIFAKQILEGLKELHERGIPHRNIKTTNILVESDGEIKLSDIFLFKINSA